MQELSHFHVSLSHPSPYFCIGKGTGGTELCARLSSAPKIACQVLILAVPQTCTSCRGCPRNPGPQRLPRPHRASFEQAPAPAETSSCWVWGDEIGLILLTFPLQVLQEATLHHSATSPGTVGPQASSSGSSARRRARDHVPGHGSCQHPPGSCTSLPPWFVYEFPDQLGLFSGWKVGQGSCVQDGAF